jgi:hypothetical protein
MKYNWLPKLSPSIHVLKLNPQGEKTENIMKEGKHIKIDAQSCDLRVISPTL